jgi:hypothetical protein
MGGAMERNADLPFALAQGGLQALQDMERGGDACDAPLLGQRRLQALQIAGGLVHVRFFDLDQDDARGGVHGDRARGGGLAHDLAVDLAFGGHVDDDVALHGGLAAEAAAIGETADAVIAFLDRVPFGQRVGGDGDTMFGKSP